MDPAQNQSTANASLDPSPGISKEQHKRLFQRGLSWLCVGVAMMAVSFGINFLLVETGSSFINFMYALTTLGSVCIMKGLVDILGF